MGVGLNQKAQWISIYKFSCTRKFYLSGRKVLRFAMALLKTSHKNLKDFTLLKLVWKKQSPFQFEYNS